MPTEVVTHNTAASFSAPLVLTGAPVGLDSAPTNLASVTAGRIMRVPPGIFVTAGTQIVVFALDGSSTTTGRFWWLDDTLDLWVPNGTIVTLTTASTNSGAATVGAMPGCKHYYQVVANAGGTTKIALAFR